MRDNQKWIKELHDFFVKDENWDIACDTVGAVEQVESHWKSLFWQNVYQQSRELFGEDLWEVHREDEQVEIHPKKGKYEVEKSCSIVLSCDKEDGCWYGIWIEMGDYEPSQKEAFIEFSENKGLLEGGEGTFYRPQVAPYLDRAQLGKVAKNNFEDAKKLVEETKEFIDEEIRNFLLTLK